MTMRMRGGVVSGVGTLPHLDTRAALDFVQRWCPELPHVPSLPHLEPTQAPIPQAALGVRGVTVHDDGRLSVDRRRLDPLAHPRFDDGHRAFAALRAFAERYAGFEGVVKWQTVGPVSLADALVRAGAPDPLAFDVAVRAVRARMRSIRDLLAEAMPEAQQLAVIDEPRFSSTVAEHAALPLDGAIDVVSGALAAVERDVVTGVHCCTGGDWPAVLAAGPALVSLPATREVVDGAGQLARFLDGGGVVAWGVVPTNQPVGASSALWWKLLSGLWCDLVTAGCDPVRLRTQSVITPTCGLGRHDEAQAGHLMALVAEVASRVADQAVATRLCVGA